MGYNYKILITDRELIKSLREQKLFAGCLKDYEFRTNLSSFCGQGILMGWGHSSKGLVHGVHPPFLSQWGDISTDYHTWQAGLYRTKYSLLFPKIDFSNIYLLPFLFSKLCKVPSSKPMRLRSGGADLSFSTAHQTFHCSMTFAPFPLS